MFGQSWVRAGFVVPPELRPDEPPDEPPDVAAGLADGSGLAALTIATPPAAIRPIVSRIVAATRRGPDARSRGGGSGDVNPVVSFKSMVSPSVTRLAELSRHEPIGVASAERDLVGTGIGARTRDGRAEPRSPRPHVPSSPDASRYAPAVTAERSYSVPPLPP